MSSFNLLLSKRVNPLHQIYVGQSHLTFFPETDEIVGDVWDDVAVVVGDGAGAQLRLSIEDLLTQLLQLGVVTVKQEMSTKFFKPINRAETTVPPQTVPLLWTKTKTVQQQSFITSGTLTGCELTCFFIVLLIQTRQMTFNVFTKLFHLTEGFLTRCPFTDQFRRFLLNSLFWRHISKTK